MKTFNVSNVISYGKHNTTAEVIVSSKTKHLRLVNGKWKCDNGHNYILPK